MALRWLLYDWYVCLLRRLLTRRANEQVGAAGESTGGPQGASWRAARRAGGRGRARGRTGGRTGGWGMGARWQHRTCGVRDRRPTFDRNVIRWLSTPIYIHCSLKYFFAICDDALRDVTKVRGEKSDQGTRDTYVSVGKRERPYVRNAATGITIST